MWGGDKACAQDISKRCDDLMSDWYVWSWHIWCVDDYNPTDAAKDLAFGLGTNPKLMDRNLGALSKAADDFKNAGLLYQWGRKDPLFGAANYQTQGVEEQIFMFSTLDAPANQGVSDIIRAIDDGATNLERVTRQSWRHVGFDDNVITLDWFDNTAGHSNGLWATTKTMYDPCPHGWRMAEIGDIFGGVITNNTWGTYDGSDSDNWGDLDNVNKGRVFTDGNDGESFYSFTGSRNYGIGKVLGIGRNGYTWSCSFGYGNVSAYALDNNSRSVSCAFKHYRANGFSVRPVHESSSASK